MFIRIPSFYERGSSAKSDKSLVTAMRSRGRYYDEDSYDSEDDYDDYDEYGEDEEGEGEGMGEDEEGEE